MKKILLLLPLIHLLVACTGTKTPSFSIQGVDIKEQKALSDIPKEMVKECKYVLFSSEDPQYLFDNVDDMIISNDNIYIKYRKNRQSKILKFDMNGRGVFCLDRQGEGPEEYNQITAFDVDKDENIHIIDGRLDELFIYDREGNLKKRNKLPYEVGAIHCLANGDYLFGLSSWNIGEAKGARLVLSDADLTVKKRIIEYDKYTDDRAVVGDDVFTLFGNEIAFNTVISNTQYMLNKDGYVTNTLTYDFGEGNISNEDKKDVENKVWTNNEARCVVGHNIYTENYVFGNVWRRKGSFSYILDKKNGVLYSGEDKNGGTFNEISNGTQDGKIVCVLRPEHLSEIEKDANVPNEVINHLKNDDFVICILRMN